MLRMHKLSLWFALFALSFLGWWWLSRPNILAIKTVKVVGHYQYISEDALVDTAMPLVQHGFFNIPSTKLREKLCRLPWIADASITRVWPDTLVIKIDEHVPIARWGKHAVVNEHGDLIFPKSLNKLSYLPLFQGPADRINEMVNKYHTISSQLQPLGLQVQALSLSERHAWSLFLTNHVEILLGREDTYERLNRLTKAYPRVISTDPRPIEKIDLRYAKGLSVTWQPLTV